MGKWALLLCVCLALSGCAAQTPQLQEEAPAETVQSTYALVVKDTENPYMLRMYEGFAQACDQLGTQAVMAGPGPEGIPKQVQVVRDLTDQRVSGIAIAANDKSVLSAALTEAKAAGVAVVSLDSAVEPQDRMVHIQQASPEMIGRALVQASARIMEGEGQFAILSTTSAAPNQASWVKWMQYEMEANPEKYGDMELVEIAYGLDEHVTSAVLTRRLLNRYSDLKLIVAPTVVGIHAAAGVIQSAGVQVKVTGLGLPSEMEAYIMNGACPWMYLWNPTELGYLAAYALDALTKGRLTGAQGEILGAGDLGDRVVTPCEDGGTEIVLGNPKMFDQANIMLWKEVF